MSKLNKADHDLVRRALTTHERVTGEPSERLIGQIDLADPDADHKATQKAAAETYAAQAKLNARVEETHQAERQARAAAQAGTLQPGNPGGGQEALVTERAKAQGISPAGREPATAAPHR